MASTVYKVMTCRNNGEEPFYIQVISDGEFVKNEFVNEEFSFNNNTKISPSVYMLLNNEYCVLSLERVLFPTERILSQITEEHIFDIDSIKKYKSCDECNKIGYQLETQDGEIYYPENSDDFKGYKNKYIKVKINDDIKCVYVSTYKYHTKEHIENVEIIEGCYSSFDECSYVKKEIEKEYCTNRTVSPEILTKSCCKC